MKLTLLGYWHSEDHPEWPDPAGFVDPEWDDLERQSTSWYLASGTIARACMGYSPCRLCSKSQNGNLEYTDGVFIWPEGLVHYLDEHSVRLPESFIRHAARRLDEIEAATIDSTWWTTVEPIQ